MSLNPNQVAHKQMTREEILNQLPDDLHKLGTVKGMMGPPSLEDYRPIAYTEESGTFFGTVWKHCKSNPFVPVGMAATVFFLGNGLRHMIKRNSWKSQYMMRGRVLAQAFTIVAVAGGVMWETYKHSGDDDSNK